VTVANTPFTVASASLGNGADVSRLVRWEAVPAGAGVDHVDFLVDGRLAGTEHDAPYLYDGDGRWDTTKVDDGAHTLTLRAVASDGRIAESTVTVLVSNASAKPKPKPAGASIVMTGFGDGAVLSGKVDWRAATTGPAPKRVEFRVDGRWRWSESSPPYVFGGDGNTWDTAKEKAGRHVVTVQAVTADGSVSDRQTFTVTIQSPWTRDSAPSATTMAVVSSVADGAALHGDVPWTAAVNGAAPARVDFYVDGMLRHTERSAPYEFGGWDTTKEANGPHTLVVRATADDGATATTTQTVHVANAAPTVTIAGQTPADGATVGGTVDWRVTTSGLRPDRVELYVDGTLRATASHYRWDTARETNGPHTLTARVVAGDRSDTRSLTVTVANAAQRTAIASSSVADGQTLAGVVAWKVATSGAAPDAVELYVDGTLRTIGTTYAWDTTREQDGAHTLLVKAYDGPLVASKTYAVSIRNAPLAVSAQSIADGATVSRTVTWTVTANADSVEFWVDGALRRTDTSGPFSYSWDTTREADGPHTLVAKARSGTRSASAAATVTVANAASVAVTQSILDGQTLSGTLTWSVTTTGPVAKVQFLVDGTSAGTFRAAPYGGSLDTRRLPNGTHSLAVRATATDGTVATASATVTVSN
jgi:hypothetical protein